LSRATGSTIADHGYRFVRQIRSAHLDEFGAGPAAGDDRPRSFSSSTATVHYRTNQYELYESYLKYLRSAHSGRFRSIRPCM